MAQKFTTGITVRDLASAASDAVAVSVSGDSNDRIKFEAGGKVVWGSGASAGDVNLYRDAADRLKTDDAFQSDGGLITVTTAGTPTLSLPDGALAIDTVNNLLYIRTGGAWEIASGGGASVTTSDAAPSAPEDGDLWYETDTGSMFVYYDDGASQQWVEVGTAGVIAMTTQSTAPTTPSNGDLWFDTDTARTYVYYDDGSSQQWVEVGAASAAASGQDGYIQFATGGSFNSASALVWDNANNRLGIGTTTPSTALHVDGSILANDSVTIGDGGEYVAGSIYSDANWGMIFRAKQASPTQADFRWANSADTEHMRIDSSGNVGIGTTSPDSVLHIEGGTDASGASGSGYLQIGPTASTNIVMDDNEIMARNNGSTANLFVNPDGGYTHFNSNVANNAVGTESLRIYGIRGQLASSNNNNELIHLYQGVNIGYPSGWGGQDAPNRGLSVYGAIDSGNPITSGQMGSAMTHPTGDTILQFNEFWVTQGGITYSSGVFTVPIAGVYRITMNPFMHGNSGHFRVLIGINNATPYLTSHYGHCYAESGSGYDTLCLDSIVSLSANDNIRFRLYSGQIYNQSGDKFNQFTIAKIA